MKRNVVSTVIIILVISSSFVFNFALGSAPRDNYWESKASMPQAIPNAKAAVVNDKIYVIGGSYNYQYDPSTNSWTIKTPMPTPRTEFGVAVCQNKIYTIGGWNFNNGHPVYYSINEVYDPSTDSWQVKQPCGTNVTQANLNVVNTEIFLIGGRTGGQSTTVSTTNVYNVTNDSWVTKESMPYPVALYASAVSDGKIYIIGGQDEYLHDGINVNFTQIYDTENNSWSFGSPTPTTVLAASAISTTGILAPKRIYLFGGNANGGIGGTNLTQVYDIQNNTWTYGAPMPVSRAYLATSAVNDLIFVFGGTTLITSPVITETDEYIPYGYGTIPQTTGLPNGGTSLDFSIIIVTILVVIGAAIVIVYVKHRLLR